MSLTLLQGYSSAEDEDDAEERTVEDYEHSEDDAEDTPAMKNYKSSPFSNLSKSASDASGLPSAVDAFSQVSGPPTFLNNCVDADEEAAARDAGNQQRKRGGMREKKNLTAGVVVEAKPQLVGIHERVRSDIEARQPSKSSGPSTVQNGEKRIATAANPNAEDAAELLRMCLQCGVPKTYSSARGMVCPICGDRPRADPSNDSKKKGSTIKEKEKSKRMKGQSSHAAWKSETEMHLRQQYD